MSERPRYPWEPIRGQKSATPVISKVVEAPEPVIEAVVEADEDDEYLDDADL